MNKEILLAEDTIDNNDFDRLSAWLKTYPRLTKGVHTIAFEQKYAETIGQKYSVFVNSGSSANLLMLAALIETGRLKNKKIVVPSLCWITDISPIIQLGLEPILVDCNMYDLSVDIVHLSEIFKKEKPAALMLVNVLGMTPGMGSISALCNMQGVELLIDNCEGLGSKHEGKFIETYGLMSSCSTYYGHIISTIEGGIVSTDDYELYNMLKMLRSHGWDRDLDNSERLRLREKHNISGFNSLYTFYHTGFNVRNTDLGAFIGLGQLDKLSSIVRKRNENFELFQKNIQNEYWKPNPTILGYVSNLGYPIIHPRREEIVNALQDNDIEVRPLISGSMGTQPFFVKKYGEQQLPNVSVVDRYGFYIPNHPKLSDIDIEFMCEIVNGFTNE